nr:reverse transcriptase domain-containing protein [Tanacetum cinerariifolium]
MARRDAMTMKMDAQYKEIQSRAKCNHCEEEYFDALLVEGSKILYSIKGTPLEDKIFAEFDGFIAMKTEENSESDEEEITFGKTTFDIEYEIKKSLDEPPMDLELKPLPDHYECAFLKEPSFLPMIISS